MADADKLDLDGLAAGKPPPDAEPAKKAPADTKPKATPKKRGTGRPPGRPRGPARKKADLQKDLEGLFSMVGAGLLAAGMARPRLAYDGQIVLSNSGKLAEALAEAAQKNAALEKALNVLVTTSAMGALGTAIGVVAVPIAANHGLLPAGAAVLVGAPLPPSDEGAEMPGINLDDLAAMFPPDDNGPADASDGKS